MSYPRVNTAQLDGTTSVVLPNGTTGPTGTGNAVAIGSTQRWRIRLVTAVGTGSVAMSDGTSTVHFPAPCAVPCDIQCAPGAAVTFTGTSTTAISVSAVSEG